jgi:hypothetical protein
VRGEAKLRNTGAVAKWRFVDGGNNAMPPFQGFEPFGATRTQGSLRSHLGYDTPSLRD